MVNIEPMQKALAAKGWVAQSIDHEPVYYGREGREGGWYITIDDDSCSDEVYKKLEELEKEEFKDGEFQVCAIVAYNRRTALEIISKMPDFEPISTTV
jgi:hypothetical protein